MVFNFFTFLDISSDFKGKIFPLKQKLYIFKNSTMDSVARIFFCIMQKVQVAVVIIPL